MLELVLTLWYYSMAGSVGVGGFVPPPVTPPTDTSAQLTWDGEALTWDGEAITWTT